jgi:hypothetical protein
MVHENEPAPGGAGTPLALLSLEPAVQVGAGP